MEIKELLKKVKQYIDHHHYCYGYEKDGERCKSCEAKYSLDQAIAALERPCVWRWSDKTKRYTTGYTKGNKCGYEVSVPMSMEVKKDLGASIHNCPFCGHRIEEGE